MKTKFLFFFLIFSVALSGQIKPGDLPKELRKDYRDTLKHAKRKTKDLEKDGWQILPSPVEVPVQVATARDLFSQRISNWGERLIIPDQIRARLVNECKFKVRGKICDTGKPNHNDIDISKSVAKNYTSGASADDGNGHGTHVAGIANAKGFGILEALSSAGIYQQDYLKILDDNGSGSFTWVAQAYRSENPEDAKLNAQGVAVVYNGSFGSSTPDKLPEVEKTLADGTQNDAYYVFAAGNNNSAPGYPGSSDYSITIAALDETLTKASYSCYGPQISNAAPGTMIQSTWKGGTYATISGTSMASPFVFSCVVIAKAKWGTKIRGTLQMKKYLAWIGSDLGAPGRDDLYGNGLIYVQRILDMDPTKMPGYGPPDPTNPPAPPTPPTTPIIPVKPQNTVWLSFPAYYVQPWKTQSSQNTYKLHIRFWLQVESNRYAEDVWPACSLAMQKFFLNQYLVIRNEDDYHDAALWSQQFLKRFIEQDQTVKDLGLKITVTRVEGFDETQRYFDIQNPKARTTTGAALLRDESVTLPNAKSKRKLKILP